MNGPRNGGQSSRCCSNHPRSGGKNSCISHPSAPHHFDRRRSLRPVGGSGVSATVATQRTNPEFLRAPGRVLHHCCTGEAGCEWDRLKEPQRRRRQGHRMLRGEEHQEHDQTVAVLTQLRAHALPRYSRFGTCRSCMCPGSAPVTAREAWGQCTGELLSLLWQARLSTRPEAVLMSRTPCQPIGDQSGQSLTALWKLRGKFVWHRCPVPGFLSGCQRLGCWGLFSQALPI